MNRIEQAEKAVAHAAKEVRRLLVEAVDSGQFRDVAQLAKIAEALTLAGARMPPTAAESASSQRSPPPRSGRTSKGNEVRSNPDSKATATPVTRAESRRNYGRTRRAKAKTEYPRFVRENETLVKIGLSKSQGATYEHRAPKEVLDAVVRRALVAGTRLERPFTAESLSDLHEHDDSVDVPGYQLYLCLAWLKRTSLIRQHGRQGYSLTNVSEFVSLVERTWDELERRRA